MAYFNIVAGEVIMSPLMNERPQQPRMESKLPGGGESLELVFMAALFVGIFVMAVSIVLGNILCLLCQHIIHKMKRPRTQRLSRKEAHRIAVDFHKRLQESVNEDNNELRHMLPSNPREQEQLETTDNPCCTITKHCTGSGSPNPERFSPS